MQKRHFIFIIYKFYKTIKNIIGLFHQCLICVGKKMYNHIIKLEQTVFSKTLTLTVSI